MLYLSTLIWTVGAGYSPLSVRWLVGLTQVRVHSLLSVSLQSFPSSDISKNKLRHGEGEAKRRKHKCFSKTQT